MTSSHPDKRSLLMNKRGFTLLEIMIAVAVIGGLLITLIYSLNYNLKIAEKHEFVTVATLLAKNKIMEIENNSGAMKGNFPEPDSGYSYVAEISESPYPGITELSVVVSKGDDKVKLSELIEKGRTGK